MEQTGLEEAKRLVRSGEAECVLLKDDAIFAQECGRGLGPLLKMYDEHREAMCGAAVVDKVVGRAAAAILICGRVERVHAELMSSRAVEFLEANGISVSYTTLTASIINRRGDGMCPMEKAIEDVTDAAVALEVLRRKIAEMRKG